MAPPLIAALPHETLLGSIARYTRFVRSTKLMLALFAAVLTLAILLYPVIKKDSGVRIAFTSISKKGPAAQTQMLNARFHGLDKSNQPFNINAKTATQIDDNTLGLDRPVGDITLNSGAWLSVSSDTGIFFTREKLLDLKGSIEMFNNDGYEFRTDVMHVNVGKKTAATRDEVDGQGPLGKLKAYGGADINGNSSVITFEGPVFVTVYPTKAESGKNTQATGR